MSGRNKGGQREESEIRQQSGFAIIIIIIVVVVVVIIITLDIGDSAFFSSYKLVIDGHSWDWRVAKDAENN
jgi:flagellar basal body-associated protein FliL